MVDKLELTRRKLFQGSAGAIALALGGGTPFVSSRTAYAAASDVAKQQLRTIGLSVTVQDRILADYKSVSGVGSTAGTAATFPECETKDPSGFKGFRFWENHGRTFPRGTPNKKNGAAPAPFAKKWGKF